MATHAHSTRTPLLPPPGAVPPLLPEGSDRQAGPVSEAIRIMRAAHPDTAADAAIEAIRQGLDRYFSEADHQRVRELRKCFADRIEADLAALDALGGDDEREADNTAYRRRPDGSFATVGLSSDDEPSLCAAGTHPGGSLNLWQGYPQSGGNCGGDAEDLERDDADDEPSLGSLHGTAAGVTFASQASWAGGARDDREHDAGDEPEVENEHGTDLDAGEAGDDNGIADRGGQAEQALRFIALGGEPSSAWGCYP